MKFRSLLRPVLGRERPVWRWLPWPRLRYRLFRDDLDCVVFSLLASLRSVLFVQIGSNDGRAGDPLWTFRRYGNWHGILVEPVDHLFRRLEGNYSPWRRRFSFENAAITREGETRLFHYLAQAEELPEGYDRLGSFDRELLERHLVLRRGLFPGARAEMVTGPVNCLSWRELCEKHGVRQLDLLHIDAEGWDREILEQVDLDRYRPSVLLYEHIHMSAGDRRRTEERLGHAGYQCTNVSVDTLAVHDSAIATMPALATAWRIVTSRSEGG